MICMYKETRHKHRVFIARQKRIDFLSIKTTEESHKLEHQRVRYLTIEIKHLQERKHLQNVKDSNNAQQNAPNNFFTLVFTIFI